MVWLKGFGIIPSSLCGFVVVDWTVDHEFEWFVVFTVYDKVVEKSLELLDNLELEGNGFGCLDGFDV